MSASVNATTSYCQLQHQRPISRNNGRLSCWNKNGLVYSNTLKIMLSGENKSSAYPNRQIIIRLSRTPVQELVFPVGSSSQKLKSTSCCWYISVLLLATIWVPAGGPRKIWKIDSLKAYYHFGLLAVWQLRVNYGINCLTNSHYQSMQNWFGPNQSS